MPSFHVTVINTATGEQETVQVQAENAWAARSVAMFDITMPLRGALVEFDVVPDAIRGAARYFTVKADTEEAYLGFGADFVHIGPHVKVVCVGEVDAAWQAGRIASGMCDVSWGIYDSVAGALQDSNTVWYIQQQEKRGN